MNIILGLSLPLALLIAIASYFGVFVPGTYAREVPLLAAQGIGQDALNLFLVAPLILITSFLAARGSQKALLIWAGAIIYALYSYVIYAFGLHYNQYFLLYCAILGLSFYAFVYFLLTNASAEEINWRGGSILIRLTAIFLIAIAILFNYIWLSEIIPATVSGVLPKSITDLGTINNAVHTIDLAFCLPGLTIVGVLLMMKKPLGFLLAPAVLVFCLLISLAIIAMVFAMIQQNLPVDISLAVIFSVISIVCALLLVSFMRKMPA